MADTMDSILSFTSWCVKLKIAGAVSSDQIIQAVNHMVSEGAFSSSLPQIWDSSEADLSTFDDCSIKEAALYLTKQLHGWDKNRVCIVSTKPINTISINLFKTHCEHEGSIVEIFETMEEAEDWANRFSKQARQGLRDGEQANFSV